MRIIAGTYFKVPKFYKICINMAANQFMCLILYTFKNKVELYNNKKYTTNFFPLILQPTGTLSTLIPLIIIKTNTAFNLLPLIIIMTNTATYDRKAHNGMPRITKTLSKLYLSPYSSEMILSCFQSNNQECIYS